MSSKLNLQVPRATEFARARQEVLQRQLNEKLEKERQVRQARIQDQKIRIEDAFDRTPPVKGCVKVMLDGFQIMFEEEIETGLADKGYNVDYSVQEDEPGQTSAWIYPEISDVDYDTIQNEVHQLDMEIRDLVTQALDVLQTTPKPAPRQDTNLDVLKFLVKQMQNYCEDESDSEDECDCSCCESEDESEDESEEDSDDSEDEEHICDECYEELYGKREEEICDDCYQDLHGKTQLCDDCREELCGDDLCDDCGLPRESTPDMCEDCGKPQLL